MLGVKMTSVIFFMMHVLFCISWHAMTPVIVSLKLKLKITQLEYTVDWVMVPLNRVLLSATTFAFMGGLDSVH